MTQTVKLSKPITAHNEKLTEIVLNAPSVDQIQQLGLPVSMDANGHFSVNAGVAMKYIPVLAAIPPSSLQPLTAFDVNSLCWAVWRFFMIPEQ